MTASLAPGSVTVVIASPRAPELAATCVASVAAQARALAAPVILARVGAGEVVRGMGEPGAMVVPVDAPRGTSLPGLRGAGLSAVRTPFAALIEDHCVAAPGWLAALCDMARAGDFVGGRMGNAQRGRAIDWAAYFAEYGFFPGTTPPGREPLATGANVLYGPRALPLAARWASEGLWEDVIHARLLESGCCLAVTSAAEMRQNQRHTVSAFCRDRYQHGFAFARVRLREQPEPHGRRWLRALASPLLPFVLARRLRASAAGAERPEFRRALPLLLVFLSAWSAGEMMGYLRGPAS